MKIHLGTFNLDPKTSCQSTNIFPLMTPFVNKLLPVPHEVFKIVKYDYIV